MSSKIYTAVIFKTVVFWVVILYSFGRGTNISGEHAVYYIFKFLWNVGSHKENYTVAAQLKKNNPRTYLNDEYQIFKHLAERKIAGFQFQQNITL